jgi:hypothetical protein
VRAGGTDAPLRRGDRVADGDRPDYADSGGLGHDAGHELGGRLQPGALRHRVQMAVRVKDRHPQPVAHSASRRASSSSTTDGSSLVNTGVGGAIGVPKSIGTDSQRASVA